MEKTNYDEDLRESQVFYQAHSKRSFKSDRKLIYRPRGKKTIQEYDRELQSVESHLNHL